MRVIKSSYVPKGMVALFRGSQFLWYGELAAPWDDVDCDAAVVAAEDFTRLLAKIRVNIEQKKEAP